MLGVPDEDPVLGWIPLSESEWKVKISKVGLSVTVLSSPCLTTVLGSASLQMNGLPDFASLKSWNQAQQTERNHDRVEEGIEEKYPGALWPQCP